MDRRYSSKISSNSSPSSSRRGRHTTRLRSEFLATARGVRAAAKIFTDVLSEIRSGGISAYLSVNTSTDVVSGFAQHCDRIEAAYSVFWSLYPMSSGGGGMADRFNVGAHARRERTWSYA